MLIQCGKEQLDNSQIQTVHTTPTAVSLALRRAYRTSCRLGPYQVYRVVVKTKALLKASIQGQHVLTFPMQFCPPFYDLSQDNVRT